MEENSISEMNREALKKLKKFKVKEAALKHLKCIQEGHSKVREIKYETLATQSYLKSPVFTNNECTALFAIRSHTLRGIKGNTPSIQKHNMSCPLKCDTSSEDVQEHIPKCQAILNKLELESVKMSITIIFMETHINKKQQLQ